jgi:ATP-binding cassette subfamily B protein
MINTLRALWLVCVIAFRVSKLQTALAFCETLGKVLYALNPLFFGIFASGAVQGDLRRMGIAVVGLAFTTGINAALQFVGVNARCKQQVFVGFEFSRQISVMMASIETLDHHEDPELLDKLEAFRNWSGTVGQTLNAVLNMINTLAFAIATLVVSLTADWRLLILAGLGVPRLLLIGRTVVWDKTAEEAGSPHSRLTNGLLDLSRNIDAGAEIRVFNLRSEILRRITAAARAWQQAEVTRTSKSAILDLVNGLFYFGGAAVIVGWIIHDAIQGRVSISALTIALTSLSALQSISSHVVMTVKWVGESARSAVRFVWFREYAAQVHARHTGEAEPPQRLESGIRLEGVSYRYTGAEADSLTGVDLELPAGSVVAIVGENGAGKSTLVKLLTGMYQPTDGRILIDDVDLADLDLTAWRQRSAGAFQDHANFELAAMQAIGLGDVGRLESESEVRRALHDGAATDVMTALPQGLQTQLGASWPGGVDLSGGQWQRIAIARGMMREDLLLLALDEPTSALDAGTEHALFDRYAEAARQAGGRGTVTLLVTHRFSTVAAADIVLVLDRGRIVEQGSHDQLMTAGGTYAELYEIQAKGYR